MLLMMVLVSEWETLIPQLLFEQLLLMSVLSLLYEKSIPWSLFEQVVFVKVLPWELLRWMASLFELQVLSVKLLLLLELSQIP